MPRVFEEACDPRTGAINAANLRECATRKTADAARKIQQEFKAAGIPLEPPLHMVARPDGTVGARVGDPRAAAVDALFARQPALGEAYKEAAAHTGAAGRCGSGTAYEDAYAAARSDAERGSVQRRFEQIFAAVAGSTGTAIFGLAGLQFLPGALDRP